MKKSIYTRNQLARHLNMCEELLEEAVACGVGKAELAEFIEKLERARSAFDNW